jgi:hypothetical protein
MGHQAGAPSVRESYKAEAEQKPQKHGIWPNFGRAVKS